MRNENFLESSKMFINDEAVRLQHAFKAPELQGEEQEMLSAFLEEINSIFEKMNTISSKQEKLIKFQIERALSCVTNVISAYDVQSETVITALHAFNDALAAHLQAHFPQINIMSSAHRLPSLNLESMELEFSGLERLDPMLDLSGFPKEDLDLLTRAPQHQPKKNNVDVLDLLFGNSVEDNETFEVKEDKEADEIDSDAIDSGVDSDAPPKKVVDDFDASTTYPPKPKGGANFLNPSLMPLSATSESMSSANPATRESMKSFPGTMFSPGLVSSPGNYYAAPASRPSNRNDDLAPTESSSALSNAGAVSSSGPVSSAHNFTQGLVPLNAPTDVLTRATNRYAMDNQYQQEWSNGPIGLLAPVNMATDMPPNPNEILLDLETSVLKAKSLYALAVTRMPLDLQFAANQGEYDAAIQAHQNDTATNTILFIFHNNQWQIVLWQHAFDLDSERRPVVFHRSQKIINIPAPQNLSSESSLSRYLYPFPAPQDLLLSGSSLSRYLYSSVRAPQGPLDQQQKDFILKQLTQRLGDEINGLVNSDSRNMVLLEWQTNRAKKINGRQRFNFSGGFGLHEGEPLRLVQEKTPVRLMQYEETFGPTKKRLLKVPHITMDNRRKYKIVVPVVEGEGAAARQRPAIVNYVIYEMYGPRINTVVYASSNFAIASGMPPRLLTNAVNAVVAPPIEPEIDEFSDDEGVPYQLPLPMDMNARAENPVPPNELAVLRRFGELKQEAPIRAAANINALRPAAAAVNPAVPARPAQMPATAANPPVPAQTPSPASIPAPTPEIPWVAPANFRLLTAGLELRKIYSPEVTLNVVAPTVAPTRVTENKNEEKTPESNQLQPQKLSVVKSIEEYYSLNETDNIWKSFSEYSRLLDIEKDHLETLLEWVRGSYDNYLEEEIDNLGRSVNEKNEDKTTAAFDQFLKLNSSRSAARLLNDLTGAGISTQYRQQQIEIVTEESLNYKARHYHAFGKVLVNCFNKMNMPANMPALSAEVSQLFAALPEYIDKFAKLEISNPAPANELENKIFSDLFEKYERSLEAISALYNRVKKEYDEIAASLTNMLSGFSQAQIQNMRAKNIRQFIIEDVIFRPVIPAADLPEFIDRFKQLDRDQRVKAFQDFLNSTEKGRKFLADHPYYQQNRDPLDETLPYRFLQNSIFEFDNTFNDVPDSLKALLMKEKILKYALEIIEIAQTLKPLGSAMDSPVSLGGFFNLQAWGKLPATPLLSNKIIKDLTAYPLELLSLIQINFLLTTLPELRVDYFRNGSNGRTKCLERLENLRALKSKSAAKAKDDAKTKDALYKPVPKAYCVSDFLIAADLVRDQATAASETQFFERVKNIPFAQLNKVELNLLVASLENLQAQCFVPGGKAECQKHIGFRSDILMGKSFAASIAAKKPLATNPASTVSQSTSALAVTQPANTGLPISGPMSGSTAGTYSAVPAARGGEGEDTENDDEKSDDGNSLTSTSVAASLNWSRPARYDAVPAARSNAAATQAPGAQGLPSLTPAAAIIPVKNTPLPSGPMSGPGPLSGPMSVTGGGAYQAVPATRGGNDYTDTGPLSGPMSVTGGGAYQAVPATRRGNDYTNTATSTSGDVTASTSSTSGPMSTVGGGLQGLPSLTPPPAAATPTPTPTPTPPAPGLTGGAGYRLLRGCGLPAYSSGPGVLWDKLSVIAMQLGYELEKVESTLSGYSFTINLKKGSTDTSISSGIFDTRQEAKNNAALLVFEHFMQQPGFDKAFFIRVPPDNDGNPTSSLLQFFQLQSMYRQGDEMQGIYRSFMRDAPGGRISQFRCDITFKTHVLGIGEGDTKRRAREEGSRRTLRMIAEAFLQLTPGVFPQLTPEEIVKLNAVTGNKGYLAVAQKQVWLKQQEQWIAQQRGWVEEGLKFSQALFAMSDMFTKLQALDRELVLLAGEFSALAQVMGEAAEDMISAAIAKRETIQKQLTALGITAALSAAQQPPAGQQRARQDEKQIPPDAKAPDVLTEVWIRECGLPISPIQVPQVSSSTDSNNETSVTSVLLRFFIKHSSYRDVISIEPGALQGIYRSFMQTSPHGTSLPVFECRLTFRGHEFAQGRGDTKRRARRAASEIFLKKLAKFYDGIMARAAAAPTPAPAATPAQPSASLAANPMTLMGARNQPPSVAPTPTPPARNPMTGAPVVQQVTPGRR